MIDTHCHLDLPVFDTDRAAVLERSRRAGVDRWLVPGIVLAAFPRLTALSAPGVHIALGLHPLFTDDHGEGAVEQLWDWLRRFKPVAVGEIGLDYLAPAASHERQRRLFEEQLDLAERLCLPVVLHVRKAHDPVLLLLQRRRFSQGGIVHAYGGSLQQAHRYLDLGFRLGFGGVVTHERARRIRRVAAALPDSAPVLETDAPDLPFAGFEGQRNEPCRLPLAVRTLARLRNRPEERIIEMVEANGAAVLNLRVPA